MTHQAVEIGDRALEPRGQRHLWLPVELAQGKRDVGAALARIVDRQGAMGDLRT